MRAATARDSIRKAIRHLEQARSMIRLLRILSGAFLATGLFLTLFSERGYRYGRGCLVLGVVALALNFFDFLPMRRTSYDILRNAFKAWTETDLPARWTTDTFQEGQRRVYIAHERLKAALLHAVNAEGRRLEGLDLISQESFEAYAALGAEREYHDKVILAEQELLEFEALARWCGFGLLHPAHS